MNEFKGRFTTIKGLSQRRRLPRLGRVRLGVKAISQKTGKEYPKETPHFVVPPEVEKIYGKEPTMLDVMLPINDPEVVFPQSYKWYGSSRGLKCNGNGEVAHRVNDDGTLSEIECPCEKLRTDENPTGECSQRASLMVILPKVNLGGIYQIDIGSYNSIIDINSGIAYVKGLLREALGVERFALIPLVLKREPRETHHDGKKQVHFTLNLTCNLTIDQLNQIKSDARILNPEPLALPAVEEINPKFDEGAAVVYDEENGDKPPETKPEAAKKPTKKLTEQPADKKDLATQEQFRALAQIEESMLLQPFEKYLLNLRIADPDITVDKAKSMINYWNEELMKRTEMKTKDAKAFYRYVDDYVKKLIFDYHAEYEEFIGG